MPRPIKYLGAFIGLIAIVTTVVVQTSGDSEFSWPTDDAVVNDITGLNRIRVARVLVPASIEEISKAIAGSTGPISIGGGRFSQGGQIAYPNSLHIDMRNMNQVVAFEKNEKEITVQAGITWRQLQEYIDTHDLSVKIMQGEVGSKKRSSFALDESPHSRAAVAFFGICDVKHHR